MPEVTEAPERDYLWEAVLLILQGRQATANEPYYRHLLALYRAADAFHGDDCQGCSFCTAQRIARGQ